MNFFSHQYRRLFHYILIPIFAISSIFVFFPFLQIPGHEIMPLYFIFGGLSYFLWIKKSQKHLILYIASVVVSLTIFYNIIPAPSFFKLCQIYIVFLTLFFFNSHSLNDRINFSKFVLYSLYLITALIFLQKLSPNFIDLSYKYLVVRSGTVENLNGRVIGISPEPSYMGSWLISIYILIHKYLPRKMPFFLFLIIVFDLLAIKSLSATLVFIAIYSILNYKNFKEYALLLFFVGALFIFSSSLSVRVFDFVRLLDFKDGIYNLYKVDVFFGSYRLQTLIEPFSSLGCGDLICDHLYKDRSGFSIFSNLFYLFAPFHFFVFLLLYFFKKDRYAFASVVCFLIYAPMLNWLLLAGLEFKGHTKKL